MSVDLVATTESGHHGFHPVGEPDVQVVVHQDGFFKLVEEFVAVGRLLPEWAKRPGWAVQVSFDLVWKLDLVTFGLGKDMIRLSRVEYRAMLSDFDKIIRVLEAEVADYREKAVALGAVDSGSLKPQ